MTPAPPVPTVPGISGMSLLARGGYATIYRAVQDSVGRAVAVKVENRVIDNERDRRRFLREARAAGQMSSHPHVVDLHDVGVTDDLHPYMIMELCDGSYAERVQAAPLTPTETRDVGVKIAGALGLAHQLGVLHRDVKPGNLLISRWGEPQLADFGLAVLAETRETSLNLEALTPAYSPPETFHPAPPTPAVDVYALCATLYTMVSGRPPRWQHQRTASIATLLELYDQPIENVSGVPGTFTDLLRLGMDNDPAARPPAMRLRELLAELPLEPAHRPPSARASAPVPDVPTPRRGAAAEAGDPDRR